MGKRVGASAAVGCLFTAMVGGNACAQQQQSLPTVPQTRTIALKSGETQELSPVYWIVACKSTVIGEPQVEIMEGPTELSLAIRPGMVVPRVQGCTNQVSGGTMVVAATDIAERKTAKLVYRVKFKTRDGDRQVAQTYAVELFP
jgi:hypothetical protein